MNVTNNSNSPTTGDDLSPEDFSDLDGAAAANSDAGSEQVGDTLQAPESQGSDTPTTSKADEAFDQFLAETDNPTPATEKPADDKAKPEPGDAEPEPASEKKQPEPKKPEEAKAEPDADIEPTADELKHGRVPAKKLMRALESRRKQKQELTAEIAKRDQALDNLLDLMDGTGLPPKEARAVNLDIGSARKGDSKAQERILKAIGYTPPAPAGPQYSDEDLMEAMERAIAHGDPEIGLDRLKARGGKKAPAVPVPPKSEPATSTAAQVEPQQRQEPRGERQEAAGGDSFTRSHLDAQLDAMSTGLVASYGSEGSKKIVEKIEQHVEAEAKRLIAIGSQLTPRVVSGLYREAQGKALAALSEKRPQAPRMVRPAPSTARKDSRSADERFEAFITGGG